MSIKNLEPFRDILNRAIERKGSKSIVFAMAGVNEPKPDLAQISDDRWLAQFSKQIFQSGFVWHP